MSDPALVRGLALMVPVAAVLAAAARRRPGEREVAAVIVATAWNLLTLAAVNALAAHLGWWRFHAEGAVYRGVPLDLLLGWALLWGALPVLVAPRAPLPLTAAVAAWLDLAVMPLGEPVVVLGEHWLAGEATAIAACLVPGLLLARWTVDDRGLFARSLAQVVLAGGLGVVLPVVLTGVWRQQGWALGLLVQALAVPLLLGVAAAREFAVSGRGTPLPYDPPRRLVTTGPYGYVRNPMQVSMAGAYLVLGVLDARFLAAVPVVVAYGAGLAAWHEGEQLTARFGAEWAGYRRAVRPWVPRPRPVMPPASVYVDTGCSTCSELGRWIAARKPSGLRLLAAGDRPGGLRRITYERADGRAFQGVAAVAHVLTHIHLGWALAGWFLMLPGITWFAQLCVDAFGYGPRAPRPPYRPDPDKEAPAGAEPGEAEPGEAEPGEAGNGWRVRADPGCPSPGRAVSGDEWYRAR
ncbi:isoprenylcysteine carboxylmethyltransferase family protein [Streptosporangium sp. NPDC002524]|uniref:isoprenylcysteine carboxylmethyltransferase family protein n=1 Tax=Streptosporangium sp. NPDC002524 TaxID=3154537 RepID=UPI003325753F